MVYEIIGFGFQNGLTGGPIRALEMGPARPKQIVLDKGEAVTVDDEVVTIDNMQHCPPERNSQRQRPGGDKSYQ
ncbi:hypothetical protein CRG98_031463 [Punica granatum]|uniref:Uncharacterized protein n=1 Tax=Punica granatum TaxID=22663 RepID=A0A2I0IW21_PUNGR|nr:hypothetical protein CRG98_031463 [Punica granatum]